MEISKIVIGDSVNEQVFCLKSLSRANDNNYEVVISDKSGELTCELAAERFSKDMIAMVGGAVKTSFIVKNGLNTIPVGIIKSLVKAEEGTFKPSELFDGLSEEKIKYYKGVIHSCIKSIPREDCKQLVAKILDEQMLSQLSTLPATLAYHGTYRGGALAATACVTKMIMQAALQYVKSENGLYKPCLDWGTLIASSLLVYVGNVDYYTSEQPFRKTPIGVERGYLSILQKRIESANDGIVDDFTLARIINILGASAPTKSGIKATSSEGIILRQCSMMYEELDRLDAGMAGYEAEEGETYFYDRKLRRNIVLPDKGAV